MTETEEGGGGRGEEGEREIDAPQYLSIIHIYAIVAYRHSSFQVQTEFISLFLPI